jgi:hypothetical protein
MVKDSPYGTVTLAVAREGLALLSKSRLSRRTAGCSHVQPVPWEGERRRPEQAELGKYLPLVALAVQESCTCLMSLPHQARLKRC